MKKAKKIGLSLNKKVISELGKSVITGGSTLQCGAGIPTFNCSPSYGGCNTTVGFSAICGDPRMTTYDCNKQ